MRNDDHDHGADEAGLPDLLLRPLKADDPLRQRLRHDLEVRMGDRPPEGNGAAAAAAAAAAEWLTRSKGQRRAGGVMVVLMLLLVLCALGLEAYGLIPVMGERLSAPAWMQRESARRIYDLPADEAPMITVEEINWDRLARARQAAEAHPDDPVLYWAYVEYLMLTEAPLPENYAATWQRIDPDNGLWLIYAAEAAGRSPPSPGWSPETTERLVREAAAKPRFHSYRVEWVRYMLGHTRPPQTTLGQIQRRNRNKTLWSEAPHYYSRRFPRLVKAEGATYVELRAFSVPAAETRAYRALYGRVALCGCMALLVLAAGVTALRRLPVRGIPGRLALCLGELERPGDRLRLVAWPLAAPLAVAGLVFWIAGERVLLAGMMGCAAVLTPLAVFTTMIDVAGRQVSARSGFLGFGAPWERRVLSGAMARISTMLLLAMLVMISTPALRAPTLAWLACLGGLALVLLWLTGRALLGYTSPFGNVRHRVMAAKMAPGLVTAAGVLAVLALGLQVADRAMTAEATAPATGR